MRRTFLAELEFDGRDFHGWQVQAEGRTVQGELERVLGRLADRPIRAHAAGRTDAGVHALAMPVSFVLDERWEPASLLRALNALLPGDCRVRRTHEMRDGFHARTSALARRYRYLVGVGPESVSPFRAPWHWAVPATPVLDLLSEAAAVIVGEHEFEAFSVRGQPRAHHRCRITEATWQASGSALAFEVEADRFLHHMVRMLVATMVDIATGRRPRADMAALLASRDNQATSAPAPARGLYFLRATYPADLYLQGREAAR